MEMTQHMVMVTQPTQCQHRYQLEKCKYGGLAVNLIYRSKQIIGNNVNNSKLFKIIQNNEMMKSK